MIKYWLLVSLIIWSFQSFGKEHDVKANIFLEEIEVPCYSPIKKGCFTIANNEEYYALFDNDYNRETCTSHRLPYVDFENYYLIHLDPLLGGCDEPDIKVDLIWCDDVGIRVDVSITQYGNCYRLWHDRIWLKIPRKYYEEDIKFNVNRIHK